MTTPMSHPLPLDAVFLPAGVTGLPVTLTFNVIDAVTTPEVQSISCEQGEPDRKSVV